MFCQSLWQINQLQGFAVYKMEKLEEIVPDKAKTSSVYVK